jgi:hypothetical protein
VTVTEESAGLVELWRQSQVQQRGIIEAQTVEALMLLNVEDIVGTWPTVERLIIERIEDQRAQSVAATHRFYTDVRRAEGITGAFDLIDAELLDMRQLVTNLRIVGPQTAGRQMALGRTDVWRNTATRVAGEASRNVLGGGRSATLNTATADKKVIGWVRVTDGNPCAFCAMLASRGVSYRPYKTKKSAVGAGGKKSVFVRKDKKGRTVNDFRAHQHCACTAKPVYSADDPLPGRAQEFQDIWNNVARGTANPLNEFRKELARLQALSLKV